MPTKRLACLLTCLLLVLTLPACGGKGAASEPEGPNEPAVSVLAPQPEPEPEPVLPYTNPLTGEGCEVDVGARRPIAVMLNNLKKALPQVGVSQADVIYEILAEGGITRMMAVFQDVAGAGEIGTVRSARDYYASLAYGHDAVYLHAGGSPQAYEFIKSRGVTALDCVNGPYEGTLFWRDQERRRSAGLEHSVLTSSETIQELLPTYQRVRLDHEEGFSRWAGPSRRVRRPEERRRRSSPSPSPPIRPACLNTTRTAGCIWWRSTASPMWTGTPESRWR